MVTATQVKPLLDGAGNEERFFVIALEEKRRSHRSYGSPGEAALAERRDELNHESITHKT